MSQTLLSQRLKELDRVGIVERRADGGRQHEWHLTEAGLALAPVIHSLGEWGVRHAQDPLREDDLDVTVLVWNLRRRVDPGVFPERRTTIYFDFTDVAEGKRYWWLVNDRGTVDLCPLDPGFPVDLYIITDIRSMIAVWFGKLSWNAAIRAGKVEVTGPRHLRQRLGSWFLLSPVAIPHEPANESAVRIKVASDDAREGQTEGRTVANVSERQRSHHDLIRPKKMAKTASVVP